MLPVLKAFAGGAKSVKETLPELKAEFALTDLEASELIPSGGISILGSRAHWARTYMAKAGLLESPRRGQHRITDAGKALLAQNPARIDNALLETLPGFSDWRTASRRNSDIGGAQATIGDAQKDSAAASTDAALAVSLTPEEQLDSAINQLETALADDLLTTVRAMDPTDFEQLVIDLLIAMGYGKGDPERGRRLGRSGDGGIDGTVAEDLLGLDIVYVQAKRNADGNTVGRPKIQEFVGSMTGEGATKGVFVTSSGFSAEARSYAGRVTQRIVLIDGAELARLMIRHKVGVRVVRQIELHALDENYFSD
jgi:restriction system protein